jgi:ferritin
VKLSQELNSAMCEQLLVELGNQNKYLQIASFFEDLQLKKLAKYFKNQSQEENTHANKFMQYINDRNGGKVEIGEVDNPNLKLFDINSVADNYVTLEENTTISIESLWDLALTEKSYIDLPFLSEMLNIQVSEEDEAQEFAGKIKATKDLILFDATFGG